MRRVRYQVACSLDGFIADADGGTDWLVDEPTIDFAALLDQFDTLVMGRRTYEEMLQRGSTTQGGGFWGKRTIVVSRTLNAVEHADVEVVRGDVAGCVRRLREEPGKDIWLFGGGDLLRTLLDARCVDAIEPAIVPVLLGDGVPLVQATAGPTKLTLRTQRVFPSGIVWLEYNVIQTPSPR